jgi:ribosomal protein L11 methyltransferase
MNRIDIPPAWSIVPPSDAATANDAVTAKDVGLRIVIQPGAGFGNGTHETTRLCLQAVSALSPRGGKPWRMLDFGSGSGILAIGAAKLGATVAAVEIDELALENAAENARLNAVADRIRYSRTLDGVGGPFELVVANILRGVLLEFADELVTRLAPSGPATLVLSGLVSTDVPEVSARYASLLGGRRPEVYERGHWRALTWQTRVAG